MQLLHVLLFHFIFIVHRFSFKHVMLNVPDGMNKVFELNRARRPGMSGVRSLAMGLPVSRIPLGALRILSHYKKQRCIIRLTCGRLNIWIFFTKMDFLFRPIFIKIFAHAVR